SPRGGGRAEVRRLVQRAARRHRRKARRARGRVTAATRARRYFEVAGAGGPVVLLHAGICDSGMWDPQWERLASGHRSVRCDFRGYGRSSLAPGTYSHPGDVIELLDELALEIGRASCRERG